MKLIVDGRIDTSGKVALDSGMFNVFAMIKGEAAGQAPVSTDGEYGLELDVDTMPEMVELKIMPASVTPEQAGKLALAKQVKSTSFVAREGRPEEFLVAHRFFLPVDFLDFVKKRTRRYHVHGTVYCEHPTYFSTLPGCRIDFFEVDPPRPFPRPKPILNRKDFLGSAYTRADGSYDFYFRFGPLPSKLDFPHLEPVDVAPAGPGLPAKIHDLWTDYKPDIRARFSQYINGAWRCVYTAPMTEFDWNIGLDFHRDYRIPSDVAVDAVDPGTKPAEGFRFKSIGWIPIDDTRIKNGYVHSQDGDPLPGIVHEPFSGTLKIFGLFAAAEGITSYSLELLKTDVNGTAAAGATWQPLEDSLTNLQWNEGAKRWDAKTLGPTAGRYDNVDIFDPRDWLEPSLKAVWNTANRVNGYYKLRITGYTADNTAAVTAEMPMICIDNDVPEAAIDVISPATTVCGDLTLNAQDRTIKFKITAYDSEGHLYSYSTSGTRGRYAESAGATVSHSRPVEDAKWEGVSGGSEPFVVAERSSATITCATMAYSFHLTVQGSGTNGYGHCLESRRAYRETNLVVTE